MRKALLIYFACIACQEPIDLIINGNPQLMVVSGWIRDTPGPYIIELSNSSEFSSKDEISAIDNAQVSVIQNDSTEYLFILTSEGKYQSPSDMLGEVGSSYRLQVVLDNGDSILSSVEILKPIIRIDSIYHKSFFIQDELNPRVDLEIFYPVINAKDPANERNFYLWSISKNDTLFDSPSDLILLDDRFINGNQFTNEFINYSYAINDKMTISVESINQDIFDILTQFKAQIESAGTSRGSAPAPLISNLRNISDPGKDVLGYFAVSAMESKELIIEK